jgi:hypothetical protein
MRKEDAMRLWIMLGVGALMFVFVVFPSGAWGATMDDVKTEMGQMSTFSWGSRISMRVHMMGSGVTLVSMTDLCVSGGRLRPMGGSAAAIDMGPVPPGNQYPVQVYHRNAIGDETFLFERKVSLPDCK